MSPNNHTKKPRTFSQACKNVWKWIVNSFYKEILVYISFLLTEVFTYIITVNNKFSYLWIVPIGLFIPVGQTFINGKLQQKERERIRSELDFQYKIAFSLSAKAIYEFGINLQVDEKKTHAYLILLVNYINSTVKSVLIENGLLSIEEEGSISTNIMVPTTKGLLLIAFDLLLPGRKYKVLPIDENDPMPGAPSAYVKRELQYVKDTQHKSVKQYFESPKYRSFFSIPILLNDLDDDCPVIAVINIDNVSRDKFKSIKFIEEKILPAVNPLITIVQLLYNIDKL